MSLDVRCLTVQFPWIIYQGKGIKPFELRKRRTHYRGPVVLCSAANIRMTDRASAALRKLPALPPEAGHALYVADLYDCFPAHVEGRAVAGVARGACTPPEPGEHVWAMRDVRALPTAQPVSGILGLFHPPPALMRYLKRAKLL